MSEPIYYNGLLAAGRSRRARRRRAAMVSAAAGAIAIVIWFRTAPAPPTDAAPAENDVLLSLAAPDVSMPATLVEGSGAGPEWQPGDSRPSHVEGEIRSGQTLFAAMHQLGVESSSIDPVVAAATTVFDFRRSRPGDRFEADLDPQGRVTWFRYQTSPVVAYEVRLNSEGTWDAQRVEVPVDVEVRTMGGTIESTLYDAVVSAGESTALAQKIVDVFQWDIDFSADVRPGDAFRLLYERVLLDGEFLRYGNILAVEYRGGRVTAIAFHYDDDSVSGFFTSDGVPVERMFLAAPCRYTRISSRFDRNRMHPVLHVRRPHLGVDYAASTGTPVWAVADGTVSFVGRRGGNGNLVTIRHAGGYESGYAHLNGFARGLRSGQEVEQGQVIGYVGSTGLSTGPHLHYGLKRRGTWVDPLEERQVRGPGLTGRSMRDFQRVRAQLEAELADIPIREVAPIAEEPAQDEVPLDGFQDEGEDHGF